jgi:peptide/nickel transport system substrate-binding protein
VTDLLRRRLLYTLVLLTGVAVLVAGWYTSEPGDDPRIIGQYVEGVVGLPQRINPLFAETNQADADLVALIFNGLTSIGTDGIPRPDLAERWEVTPDGLAYSFFLRTDVLWHDGHRFDSGDVAFTIAQIQSPEFAGSASLARAWAEVEVTTPTERIVVARRPEPSASFLSRTSVGVLPEHLLRGV